MIYRPGLARETSQWWPKKPKPSGGVSPWEPGEAELKWLATGKGVRKKSTATHMLCVGGPYHNARVQYHFYKKTGRVKYLEATMPDVFTTPPFNGRYKLEKVGEPTEWRYVWVNG
jgi:hypothetical protein